MAAPAAVPTGARQRPLERPGGDGSRGPGAVGDRDLARRRDADRTRCRLCRRPASARALRGNCRDEWHRPDGRARADALSVGTSRRALSARSAGGGPQCRADASARPIRGLSRLPCRAPGREPRRAHPGAPHGLRNDHGDHPHRHPHPCRLGRLLRGPQLGAARTAFRTFGPATGALLLSPGRAGIRGWVRGGHAGGRGYAGEQ